jgi:predicted anti-sigma-YlaC factor YlaD
MNSVGVWVAVRVKVGGSRVLVGRSVWVGLGVDVAVADLVGEAVSN